MNIRNRLATFNRTGPPAKLRSEVAADIASIYVYDVIDAYWGISAQAFAQAMLGARGKTVHLHINSPGGDVFEAQAMVAAIVNHDAPVHAFVDGLAASAATHLAIAASQVEMGTGAFFMIHQSWSMAFGNADDMTSMASLLGKIDDMIAGVYATKTGKTAADMLAAMQAETWYTAQEAVDAGFANSIAAPANAGAGAAANVGTNSVANLARQWGAAPFKNAPKALTEAPSIDQEAQATMDAAARAHRERYARFLDHIA